MLKKVIACLGTLALTMGVVVLGQAPAQAGFMVDDCYVVSNPTPQMHTECAGVVITQGNFNDVDLRWADFSGATLHRVQLVGADAAHANFSGADLRGELDGHTRLVSLLYNANFAGANFTGADLRLADLRGSDFSGANLSVADLSGELPGGAAPDSRVYLPSNLRGANLAGANLTAAHAVTPADYRGANFAFADLTSAAFVEVDLSHANFTYATLDKARLDRATMIGADLSGTTFRQAVVTGANVSGTELLPEDIIKVGAAQPVSWAVPTPHEGLFASGPCKSSGGLTSGSTFPVGRTYVTCRFNVSAGGSGEAIGKFMVIVQAGASAVIFNLSGHPPKIGGVAKVGSVLTALDVEWNPAGPNLTYAWYAGGVALPGQTARTLTVDASMAGKQIHYVVRASMAGFMPSSVTSETTATVPVPNQSTTLPVIAGTAAVGEVLTTDHGTWARAADSFARQWLRDGVAIPAATDTTYQILPADLGRKLSVRVTALGAGSEPGAATSAATSEVALGAPAACTVPPSISGTLQVGSTLSTTTGAWGVSGLSFSHQWTRDGADIAGATGATHLLVPADRGRQIAVTVTAARDGHQDGTATSDTTTPVEHGPAAVNTQLPKVTGKAHVGQDLSASNGIWNPSAVGFLTQWHRDGTPIPGATSSVYRVQPADIGHQLSAVVTARAQGYQDGTASSLQTASVLGLPATATVPPEVIGAAKVGKTLTVTEGTWDVPGLLFAYQWLRDGTPISGATGDSHQVQPVDLNHAIAVQVTATHVHHLPATLPSTGTASVSAGDGAANIEAPEIAGTVVVGEDLVASNGTWDAAGLTFSHQWLRNGVEIAGATASRYEIRPADHNALLSVSVTAVRVGHQPGTANSSATSPVIWLPAQVLTAPQIAGVAEVKQTLAAMSGTWTNQPTSYGYQWLRNGAPIAGATIPTYKLKAADAGTKVTVRVTALQGTSESGSAESAAAAVAKVTSKVKATVTKRPAQGQRGVIRVKVKAGVVKQPTGRVQVLRGKKVIGKAKLKVAANGTVKVKVRKLAKGNHKVRVVFAGDSRVLGSRSKPIKVKIR